MGAADEQAVLFANDAFYSAFASRDLAAMEAVWASRLPVACIHPGWGALAGRAEVMASWRSILAGDMPAIACKRPTAVLLGDCAFVICFEQIGEGLLIATNIFAREDGSWKMVHHQAGLTAEQPEDSPDEEATVVH